MTLCTKNRQLIHLSRRQRSTGFQPVGQPGVSPGVYNDTAGWKPAGPTAKMAVLQQIHLRILRHRFGEPNAETDEAHRFSGAGKCF